jgi:hypothetical protein
MLVPLLQIESDWFANLAISNLSLTENLEVHAEHFRNQYSCRLFEIAQF